MMGFVCFMSCFLLSFLACVAAILVVNYMAPP
jgi:hypothetical protein